MKALGTAMLDEFIAAQPVGLETRIGDNGALSGGQRQRLGLARAILRGGDLLLWMKRLQRSMRKTKGRYSRI